ncbi:MAG: T9SS type A sorting domain-containing protein [Bacteroidales bacterium]|nr:T9SS type A sorting domain-containing protein [Bacteroidales bacterium]
MKKLALLLLAFTAFPLGLLAQHYATRAFLDEEGVIRAEKVLDAQLPPVARDGLAPMPGFPLSFSSNTTYKPMRGLALADLNNDGADEIILCHNEEINVIDGQGNVVWTQPLVGGMAQYPAAVGDIDGDGTLEIVVLTAYGNARGGINVFSNTGEVLLATVTNNNPLICAPVLADLNNDGELEIVFSGRGKASANISAGVHVWNLQGEEIEGFPFEMPSTPAFTPTLADCGDGTLLLFTATTSALYYVNNTGTQLNMIDSEGAYKYSYQSPLVVDLFGHGFTDWSLVGACHGDNPHHYARCIMGDGDYLDGWPKPVSSWTYSAPTAVKNGDEYAIFMGVSGEGNVFYQYDAEGNVAPGFPLNLSSGIEGFISVADIDGDGENEIITDFNLMDGEQGYIRAWEMDGTEVTEGFPLRPQGLSYMNGANFGDINGDGMLEIVTLTYVQNFSPDDPVYVTAYALNQPVENLVFGTYKGSNDRMGWIREETIEPECFPVRNLEAETFGDMPKVVLKWIGPIPGSTGNLSGYRIMKDGMLLETLQHPLFEYTDLDVDFDETHVYIVIAVFDDGCERASEPLSVTVLWDAVQEHVKEAKVYPNPANNLLHVEGARLAQVEVFNIMGQSVLRICENFEDIDISRLQNGIYFVCLKTNDGEKSVKLVVEK